MGKHKIICGKSEIELKQFDDDSFDSCVCDPPYNLTSITRPRPDQTKEGSYGKEVPFSRVQSRMSGGFMGKEWDSTGIPFKVELWEEVYRVVKPGAHILVAGIARTHHRMWVALEDAGFDIIDGVYHLFGSGFPKSLDIAKNLDKILGEEREIIGIDKRGCNPNYKCTSKDSKNIEITAPVSEEAKQFEGFGTQLKPAVEIWCLARKPISERNIASNVLRWGVGGINIKDTRIWTEEIKTQGGDKFKGDNVYGQYNTCKESLHQGRFPANLILDEEAGKMLDEQSGESVSNKSFRGEGGGGDKIQQLNYRKNSIRGHNDNGGASRFFYQAKASQNERWFYCTICKKAYPMKERDKHTHNAPEETKYKYLEFHPTQKPESLISYLMRLITPPNGTTIDPFLGSGTAIVAAEREGFNCVGIDSKPEYCEIGYVRGKAELMQQKISGEQSTIERIGF